MPRSNIITNLLAVLIVCTPALQGAEVWRIETADEWRESKHESTGIKMDDGMVMQTKKIGFYRSVNRTFPTKRSPASLIIKQSPAWQNWNPISNIGPVNLRDAPVLIAVGPDNYWIFGRYSAGDEKGFKPEAAEVEGFDIPLMTTPFPNQYDAPGGLKPRLGGYHAWQSRDMVNWVHHGPVTESFSRWVTTAEYVDGKAYIYYDFPNDQDPHLYIDDDLTDGKPGKHVGLAFKDPSHGSDCAIIRDLKGHFHVIYEDWSPINAKKHSWDSPLAGHAVSEDGLNNFRILPPAVDDRTKPTGTFAEYVHPHWTKEDPGNFPSSIAAYEIHEPEQNAYGDWAAISVGGQYYLFCDYHPANDNIRVGWFTSSSLDVPFTFSGELDLGHPDPDIIFAEGKFYLVTQMKTDYVSPGPWVDTVEVRFGVDTNGDSTIDHWTDWQAVSERYDYIEGFAKQIKRTPASIDLSSLPDGVGFCFELRLEDVTENDSQPVLDSVSIFFDDQT